MKKFMKVCAIIAAIILGIGIVLLAVGGCGGGFRQLARQIRNGELSFGPEDWNIEWDEKWVWNEDWQTYDLDGQDMFDNSFDIIKDRDAWSQDFSTEGVQNLELALGGCKVTVEPSTDEEFHILANKITAFQAYVKNGTLYVRGLKTGNWTSNFTMEVTIQIPDGTEFSDVTLSLGAGDFSIVTITAQNMDIEVGAGRLQIDEMKADTLSCQLGAGQVIINNAEVTGNTSLEVGVGELCFTGSLPGNLDAECAMGNMEITVAGSREQDHNLDLECAAGNLTAGSHTFAGLASEQYIDNGAASTYKLRCSMGNLSLTFR